MVQIQCCSIRARLCVSIVCVVQRVATHLCCIVAMRILLRKNVSACGCTCAKIVVDVNLIAMHSCLDLRVLALRGEAFAVTAVLTKRKRSRWKRGAFDSRSKHEFVVFF